MRSVCAMILLCVCQAMGPLGVCLAMVPLGVCLTMVPLGVCLAMGPLGVCLAMVPLGVCLTMVPLGVCLATGGLRRRADLQVQIYTSQLCVCVWGGGGALTIQCPPSGGRAHVQRP